MKERKTILIIEQEVNLANGLRAILENEGYAIVCAFEHSRLQELFRAHSLDLAIINIYTPKELGLNIVRNMRQHFPSLPIVAMTVYSNSFTKGELRDFGVNEFISKPFEVDCLKEMIERLLCGPQ